MKHESQPRSLKQQRGAVLVVALILLLIITILGIASSRMISMEEHMSGNFLDRGIAFQSAESGLRILETPVAPATLPAIFTVANYPPNLAAANYTDAACNPGTCAAGDCNKPDPACPDRFSNPAFLGWAPTPAIALGPLAIAPTFISENMGVSPSPPRWEGCEDVIPMDATCVIAVQHYRVTTRSAAGGRANVLTTAEFTNAL